VGRNSLALGPGYETSGLLDEPHSSVACLPPSRRRRVFELAGASGWAVNDGINDPLALLCDK